MLYNGCLSDMRAAHHLVCTSCGRAPVLHLSPLRMCYQACRPGFAGNDRLFRWLPIYNLTVIALTLAYQAPLHELTFGKWTAADEVDNICGAPLKS